VVPVFLLPRKLDPNFLFFLRQLDWRSGVKLHGESIPIAIIFFEWFSQMKIQQKVRLRKPYEKEDGCWQKRTWTWSLSLEEVVITIYMVGL
jgi:hypothetical protein